MTTRIHLSIMQPAGYIHSQGFLDQARYARYQFRRLGAEVSIGKNRLREDSINIIFGAHLGFVADLRQRYTCVFFNLEQLGEGGARVSQDYMNLLRSSAVIDYDERNLAAYGCQPGDVPVVSFQYAPYLATAPNLPLQDRPIDLLFFGSVNERRKAIFSRIEACGLSVSMFDHPLYGEERDQFIRQAKAVFNCHFYESSRFEQARAFHTLSLGTPVISERTERTTPPPAFEDAVSWVRDEDLEAFFTHEFMTPQWQQQAEQQLQAFAQTDASNVWLTAHGYCQALWTMGGDEKAKQIWRPRQMNLGSGKDYKAGWLNVDILERAYPDLVLDLGQEVTFPVKAQTLGGGQVVLEANSLDAIYANNVLEHVPDLPRLMTNLLALLKEDGEIELEVPYEKSMTAWQDPTHLRAMNLNSWLYYTGWFWYLGWFEHRFEMAQFNWLDNKLGPCDEDQAAFMRVKLKKVCTTAHEKSIARTMQPDFGGLATDITGAETYGASKPTIPMDARNKNKAPDSEPTHEAINRNVSVLTPSASIKPPVNKTSTQRERADWISGAQCLDALTDPKAGAEEIVRGTEAPQAPRPSSLPNALVVVSKARTTLPAKLDTKLLAALPAAKKVLELGSADSPLAKAYLERHPGAQWLRADPQARVLETDDDRFDLLVLSDGLPNEEILAAASSKASKNAMLFASIENGANWNSLEQLLTADSNATKAPFSPAAAYKQLLDAGWMPTLIDQYQVQPPAQAVIAAMDQMADALGMPRQTAQRNLNMARAVIQGTRSFEGGPRKAGPALFSVVVPTTRDGQLRANVESSPGLHEVEAQIISYRGARNPAEALSESLAHCDAKWVLFCHQDVYFPQGFGEHLNALLSGVPAEERSTALFGFMGMGVNRETLACEPRGFVIDRLHRADHPESDAALSIDELAIVVARESIHHIDPRLGWHLWATDLCLTSVCTHKIFPRIVRLPIFHNSVTDYTLPSAFDKSAALLKDKFPQFGPIHTLCKVIK